MPKIYVDFYDVSPVPGPPWSYNQFNTFTIGQLSNDLRDDTNASTGVTLDIVGASFTGKLGAAGTSIGADVWPDDVHNFSFYGNNAATALQFGSLPVGTTFTLELAGHPSQVGRNTNYTVTPSNEGTLLYVATGGGNVPSNPVVFTGTVGGAGTIDVDLALVSAFFYIDGMTLEYSEGPPGKQATARLADINGADRANRTNLTWAWYDQLPAFGVSPTDFANDGVTDGSGFITVDIDNSTLAVGQTGYLAVDDVANGWTGFYAVVVSEG